MNSLFDLRYLKNFILHVTNEPAHFPRCGILLLDGNLAENTFIKTQALEYITENKLSINLLDYSLNTKEEHIKENKLQNNYPTLIICNEEELEKVLSTKERLSGTLRVSLIKNSMVA